MRLSYGTHVTRANEPTLQLLFPQSSAVPHPFRPRNHPNVLIKVLSPRLYPVHYLRLPWVKQQTAPPQPQVDNPSLQSLSRHVFAAASATSSGCRPDNNLGLVNSTRPPKIIFGSTCLALIRVGVPFITLGNNLELTSSILDLLDPDTLRDPSITLPNTQRIFATELHIQSLPIPE
ncbi:uncharacterized protein CLUP02_01018 [Colletotrichum lupini]|uniref:Uncharacterized protein n=1 Tax=Colletotrichum lupini TaxID=145971 RepID=A0A9Q8SBX2_9PEZI|nr:uncharacterized protein CLUP02_01018 [Colletotrichum lupini]UQC74370.1 hypothetical protein CLUP02_01018 [Colletotrichum lupini]